MWSTQNSDKGSFIKVDDSTARSSDTTVALRPKRPFVNDVPLTRRLSCQSWLTQQSRRRCSLRTTHSELHRQENIYEYEDDHWLFSLDKIDDIDGESLPQTSRRRRLRLTSELSARRYSTPVEPDRLRQEDITADQGDVIKDDRVSIWLSGVHAGSDETYNGLCSIPIGWRCSSTSDSTSGIVDNNVAALKVASIATAQLLRGQLYASCEAQVSQIACDHNIQPVLTSSFSPSLRPSHISNRLNDKSMTGKPATPRHQPMKQSTRARFHSHGGSGFDGPDSPLSDDPRDAQLGPGADPVLSYVNRPPTKISGTISPIASGSIDWEKRWVRRNPRKVHNVSEVSTTHPTVCELAVDTFPQARVDDDETGEDRLPHVEFSIEAKQHDHYHAANMFAVKSCPELHRTLVAYNGPSNANVGNITTLFIYTAKMLCQHHCIPAYASNKTGDEIGWNRHSVRDSVSRRFRSFGRRLQRFSSRHSVHSDFPVQRGGGERRQMAQGSGEIYASSGDESPVFNSPASDVTPSDVSDGNVSLLALAVTMIATAELDRLSSYSDRDRIATGSLTCPPPQVSSDSPASEADIAANVVNIDTSGPVTAPERLDIPDSGIIGLRQSASPLMRGQQRGAATRSRLSEVTTPEDYDSLEQSARAYFDDEELVEDLRLLVPSATDGQPRREQRDTYI
jgi:hypothetical protein